MVTSRDSWVFNSSKTQLIKIINDSIDFYNTQVDLVTRAIKANPSVKIENIINWDSTKFKWDRAQKERDLKQGKKYHYTPSSLRISQYRPYYQQWVYFNRDLNNCVYQLPKLFPSDLSSNLLICISGLAGNKDFSVLITQYIPCFDTLEKTQCFPLYWYDDSTADIADLFSAQQSDADRYVRRDGVTTGSSLRPANSTAQSKPGGHLLLCLRHPPCPGLPHDLRRRSQEVAAPIAAGRVARRFLGLQPCRTRPGRAPPRI